MAISVWCARKNFLFRLAMTSNPTINIFSHVGQNHRFLVVYRHCGNKCFSQAIYTGKVGIKSGTSRSGALFYQYAIALPTSQKPRQLIRFSIKWLSVSPYNAVSGNVDIISLKQFTHIHRHSTNVTYMYVLCAMIHVCHCRHQHLDNWAFNVCVCGCVWVCVCVCAIRLCILVLLGTYQNFSLRIFRDSTGKCTSEIGLRILFLLKVN